MHRRSFARALDDLHGFFDRLPQASDLCARADIKILFLDALAPRNRQRQTHPVGDLAAPHRDIQFRQTFARRGDDRRLDVSTPGRRAVENDRIGRSQPAGKSIVSCTASISRSPGRHGMMTSLAARIASTTLAETFAGVSMNTQSTSRRFAFFRTSASSRLTVLIGRAASWRNAFHSVNDPCRSSSISRQRRSALCA